MNKEQAIEFLQRRLQIENVTEQLQNGRLNLLNTIAEKWLKIIPFQSISQVCRDRTDRSIQSVEQCLEDITSGVGGLCWSQNVSLYHVLKALGFDVYLAKSAVMHIDELNHTAPVIRNVEQVGDTYLMDVGTGYPCFTAVSLDFQHESPIFDEFFATYKFIKEDNCIKRLHLTSKGRDKAGRLFPKHDDKGWGEFLTLWLKECDIGYIKDQLDKNVYSNLDFKFNNCLRIVKFPNCRLKAISDDTLLTEDQEGTIEERKLSGIDEIKSVVKEHFPEIPTESLVKALEQWQNK